MAKLNFVKRLQNWMDSVPGQTFLNYAYSWGASVVILGALFKLTHLPGGNLMLFLGMGTETIVFFLAGFDRPFDKLEIGKEIPDEEEYERQVALDEMDEENQPVNGASSVVVSGTATINNGYVEHNEAAEGQDAEAQVIIGGGQQLVAGSPIIIGGGSSVGVSQPETSASDAVSDAQAATQAALAQLAAQDGEATMDNEAKRLAEIIRLANDELLRRAQAVLSPEMEEATSQYVEKLQTLNETLAKVDKQSARLTQDSLEMENLNRTLIGINKVYDLHFASISRQVTTIEQINDQTQQLAQKIEEVNAIYERMMKTLSVMANPAGATRA